MRDEKARRRPDGENREGGRGPASVSAEGSEGAEEDEASPPLASVSKKAADLCWLRLLSLQRGPRD